MDTSEDHGLWLTITELAQRKGLGKPAVSERVARMEAAGQLATRPGKGRAKLVNLAEFDRAAGETTDLGRAQGAATRRLMAEPPEPSTSPPAGADPVYTREQARLAAYRADLAKLELDERCGKLFRADRMTEALAKCGAAIVGVVDRLPNHADDLATIVAKEGTHGLRVALKQHASRMRTEIANALHVVAEYAPEFEYDATPTGEVDQGALQIPPAVA